MTGCGNSTVPPLTPQSQPTPTQNPPNYSETLTTLESNQNIQLDPATTYDLSTTLSVQNLNNVTLNGNGARIVMHDPTAGFLQFRSCSNITVANLTLDYDPLPFTQGTITAVDTRTFQVTLDPGFPDIMQPYFLNAPDKWGLLRERKQPLQVKQGAANVYPLTGWTQNGTTYTLTTNGTSTAAMQPGDAYVQLARYDGSPAFAARVCSNVTYQGITIHASPAAGFIALNCSAMSYLNNRIQPLGQRHHSTCADGIFQVQGSQGPIIEGNIISTNGDDGIIVKTIGANETGHTPDNKTFTLQSATTQTFLMAQGDRLEVYNPNTGRLLGSAQITALSNNRATLDTAIPGVTPACYFYNQNQCLSGFSIRNNQLISNRRWGIFCCGRNGTIAQNNVLNSNAQGLMLMNADQGMQDEGGLAPANITIQNNTFTDCFLQTPGSLSTIQGIISMVTIFKDPGRATNPVDDRLNRNLTLSNNTVTGGPTPALNIQCADGILVENSSLSTIQINNANNVTIANTPTNLQSNPLNVTNLTVR